MSCEGATMRTRSGFGAIASASCASAWRAASRVSARRTSAPRAASHTSAPRASARASARRPASPQRLTVLSSVCSIVVRASDALLPRVLDRAKLRAPRAREKSLVEFERIFQLRLAGKFLFDDTSPRLAQRARARGVCEQRDDVHGHARVVAGPDEVARLAFNDGLARAAHVGRNDRAPRGHVFEDGVGEALGL